MASDDRTCKCGKRFDYPSQMKRHRAVCRGGRKAPAPGAPAPGAAAPKRRGPRKPKGAPGSAPSTGQAEPMLVCIDSGGNSVRKELLAVLERRRKELERDLEEVLGLQEQLGRP